MTPSTRPLVTGCRRPLISRCVNRRFTFWKMGKTLVNHGISLDSYADFQKWVHNDLHIDQIWIYGFLGKKWSENWAWAGSFQVLRRKMRLRYPWKSLNFHIKRDPREMVASHSTSMLERHENLFVIRSFYKGNIISYPTFVVFTQW